MQVSTHGNIWLFTPENDEELQFAKENIATEPYQWLGGSFAVEHRYGPRVAEQLQEDGFEVSPG